MRKFNSRNTTNKLGPNKPNRTRDSRHIPNMFFMEPPELCGPGRGGRISGPIQRTYIRRGLANYVEAGNSIRKKPAKYLNGAVRTGQKQKPARNSGPKLDCGGLMDGNIRRNRAPSALGGCNKNFFHAFRDRHFLGHAVYRDSLQEPMLAVVVKTQIAPSVRRRPSANGEKHERFSTVSD